MIPNGDVVKALIGLNVLGYMTYLVWPKNKEYSYLNNFAVSSYSLKHGYLHTLITSHFSHTGFLSFVINTVILGMIGQNF